MLYVCPAGTEDLLRRELLGMGARSLRLGQAQVRCLDAAGDHEAGMGGLQVALRACLQSRLASRVLWPLAAFPADSPEALYSGASAVDWPSLLSPDKTLAVLCKRGEGALAHTAFVAQKVKDAIVDSLRRAHGIRPDIDRESPDALIHVFVRQKTVHLAFDLAGESLHRRGYRLAPGPAPLQETLAAAVLLRAGWPSAATRGEPLVDPMCGSGTLLCEAAAMARQLPANAERERFGADGLLCLPRGLWQAERALAREALAAGLAKPAPAPLFGLDADPAQLRRSRAALGRLGLHQDVSLIVGQLRSFRPKLHGQAGPGLIVTNPPYGQRLQASMAELQVMLGELGEGLKAHAGWRASVLVGEREQGYALGLKADRVWQVVSGGLPVTQLFFLLQQERGAGRAHGGADDSGSAKRLPVRAEALPPQSDFSRRLAKVGPRWLQRAEREQWGAVRVYDADLPDYAAAIDCFVATDQTLWVYLQEYAPPREVPEAKAQARLRHMVTTCVATFGVDPKYLVVHTRRRQRDSDSKYRQKSTAPRFFWLQEKDAVYRLSLDGYVDTGLYLDHRTLRAHICRRAAHKRMLNLFGYTATMTVAAGLGGARESTTVDKSATYLDWAVQNLRANRLHENHQLVRADVMPWLERAQSDQKRYDLIFVGPPTYSNSHSTSVDFEVGRDHAELIALAMGVLAPGGELYFGTHKKGFRLSPEVVANYAVNDLTATYCPADFLRRRPHRLWRLVHQSTASNAAQGAQCPR